MEYQSTNEHRHKGSDSLYAHYSMIDEYDCDKFPKLSLTRPQHFTLRSGQSLYIPKGWWHWVKTVSKSFAVNYWFNNATAQEPFVFDHTIAFDANSLNGQTVAVWNSGKNVDYSLQMVIRHFQEFYNSGEDERYVITLKNYPPGVSNSVIKEIVSEHIHFPVHPNIELAGEFDFNVWISSGKHDTGLHYDDEDGVLTVVDGEKEIILFPPSDTDYLYPFSVSYEWTKTPAMEFRYNTGQKIRLIDGVSCGDLLYATCNNDKRVLSNISNLYQKYKHNYCLVWGFKKKGEEYRWEFYNGTLSEDVRITSWDIYPGQLEVSDQEHYYFKLGDPNELGLPFWGYGKYKEGEELLDESKIFVVDGYEPFREKYDEYMTKLGYEAVKESLHETILHKYSPYNICIHNKKPGEIFVQYLGLTNEEFVEFLTENNYPAHITQFVTDKMTQGKYKINNEITIVYNIETQEVVRSGFYGNL